MEELTREKIAKMNGRVVIIDALDNTLINSIPISVTHEFRDYSCTYRGDKRALSNDTNKRIKNRCDPFPSDYEITNAMAYAYKSTAEESLNNQYFKN